MSEFVNHMGQTLIPGDDVVVVSQGYCHRINVRRGVFSGVSKSGYPQAEVNMEVWGYVNKETGERTSYSDPDRSYRKISVTRRTTLPRGRVYKLAA